MRYDHITALKLWKSRLWELQETGDVKVGSGHGHDKHASFFSSSYTPEDKLRYLKIKIEEVKADMREHRVATPRGLTA